MLGKRRSKQWRCDIRSECRAAVNRRYYERLLAKDWDEIVIKRDPVSGRYTMNCI